MSLTLAQEIRLQARTVTRPEHRRFEPNVSLERDVEVAESMLRAALGRMLAARGLPGVKRVIHAGNLLELADHIQACGNWES